MKKKDFELIVPAYDALEAELEEILGGKCTFECDEFKCKSFGFDFGPGDCIPPGMPAAQNKPCCTGITIFIGEDLYCQ